MENYPASPNIPCGAGIAVLREKVIATQLFYQCADLLLGQSAVKNLNKFAHCCLTVALYNIIHACQHHRLYVLSQNTNYYQLGEIPHRKY